MIGSTKTTERQKITQDFNQGDANVCTISTKAGGIGLNFFGANRVILMDEWFNPMIEQQAIGRAYRIGQRKKVFVYRLATAGTYEDTLQQQSVFKTQLAARVVDQKNLVRSGSKTSGTYIFDPREVEPSDISDFLGRDTAVLDKIMHSFKSSIMSIKSIESFQKEDDIRLTEGEEELAKNEQLYYRNPAKYQELINSGKIKHPIQGENVWMRSSFKSNATPVVPHWMATSQGPRPPHPTSPFGTPPGATHTNVAGATSTPQGVLPSSTIPGPTTQVAGPLARSEQAAQNTTPQSATILGATLNDTPRPGPPYLATMRPVNFKPSPLWGHPTTDPNAWPANWGKPRIDTQVHYPPVTFNPPAMQNASTGPAPAQIRNGFSANGVAMSSVTTATQADRAK